MIAMHNINRHRKRYYALCVAPMALRSKLSHNYNDLSNREILKLDYNKL